MPSCGGCDRRYPAAARLFDAAEDIEIERGVILQEIGQALDTPDDIIFDWLQEVAYPEQPLGRSDPGPGRAGLVVSARERFGRAFVAQHYGPGDMILAAAGADVDHDAIDAVWRSDHVRRYARRATSGKGSPSPRALARRRDAGRIKALEQVHFAHWRFEGPGLPQPMNDLYAAQIFATAFGRGHVVAAVSGTARAARACAIRSSRSGGRLFTTPGWSRSMPGLRAKQIRRACGS